MKVKTKDKKDYSKNVFGPISNAGFARIKVAAKADVHIGLSEESKRYSRRYEIVLGAG